MKSRNCAITFITRYTEAVYFVLVLRTGWHRSWSVCGWNTSEYRMFDLSLSILCAVDY